MQKKLVYSLTILVSLTVSAVLISKTAAAGKWWDKFGTPQYGGTIIVQTAKMEPTFDPDSIGLNAANYWFESFIVPDWTLDRNKWSFTIGNYVPEEYNVGGLAKSWSWDDPRTMTIKLKQNIRWQNKAPLNGRQFTAEDALFNFDRMMGTGHGFTEPKKTMSAMRLMDAVAGVSAPDKFTLRIKFKSPAQWSNFRSAVELSASEAPDVYKLGLGPNDPARAIGTGPYMFGDLVRGTSITLVKNPGYWANDGRFPKNRLPYADEIKILAIPDSSTALAALRTGKISLITGVNWQQALSLKKTNPELVQSIQPGNAMTLDMRNDKAPFTDLRVRTALQMAIDIPKIAQGYYGGYAYDKPVGLLNPGLKGYANPYDEWPQSVKNQYTYNPAGAKKLLADAGYPNGFKTNIVVGSGEGDTKLLEVIKSYFRDIGVEMEIRVMDMATEENFVGQLKHDQMACIFSAGLSFPPNIAVITRSIKDNRNLAQNNDPVYEDLVAQASSLATEADAKRVIKAADMRFITQHYVLVTPGMNTYNICQPNLKGYSGEAGGMGGLQSPPIFYLSRFWISRK